MFFLLFFILTFFQISSANSEDLNKDKSIIVLMYHRFNDERFPSTSISSKKFDEQMSYLKKENFTVLPISDLVSYFENKLELPDRSIFITIDDGYKSFYKNGYPILKKNDFPFSVFLSSSFVSNATNDFMSWEMLRELSLNNGDILNHTVSHPSLIKLENSEIKKEILDAEKVISLNMNGMNKIISYPYGDSNPIVEKIVQELGYKIAFAQHSGPVNIKESKFKIPRFSINDQFGKISRFKQIVNSLPLNINNLKTLEKNLADGNLTISFDIDYNTKNLNCFINNSATLEKKNISFNNVKLKITNLKKNQRYRLNCTYFNKSRRLFLEW